MNATFLISLFDSKTDNQPKEKIITWADFCARVRKPHVRARKDGCAFAPCRFEPSLRRKKNVRFLSILVYDVDAQIELDTLHRKLHPLESAFAIYSTHSHRRQTEKNPNAETRWHVVVPLAEPVEASEYLELWHTLNAALDLRADENARDASRMHFIPAKADTGAEYEHAIEAGENFFRWREFLARHAEKVSAEGSHKTKPSDADCAPETGRLVSHDARHAELCRLIEQKAKRNSRGAFEMRCPAHAGKGETSLVYFPDTSSVKCLTGCDYFAILRAFGLSDERLPKTHGEKANAKLERSKLAPLRTVKLSEVEKKSVKWLWKPFIAQGAFTIIEGEEGIGKSWLLCAIACAVAQGYGLPNSFTEEPANVLLLSAEDSLSFTLKPRLEAMNAPCERIIAVDELFTLDADGIFRLELAIAEHAPRLVIIDPLFAYTSKTHLDKDNEIRSVTSELTRLAEKYETAIDGVRHIGKSKGLGDPRAAGLNGIGWRASARSVLLIGKDPDNESRKAIVQTKNNLAEKCETAIGFEIRDNQFFWTGESTLTASRMLALARSDDERAEQSEAVSFLREALRDGEREANEITRGAEKLQITPKQLRNARLKLGVKLRLEGFGKDRKSFWLLLPTDAPEEPAASIDARASEKGHLCVNGDNKTSCDNGLIIDALSSENGHLGTEISSARASMDGKLFAASPAREQFASNALISDQAEVEMACGACGARVESYSVKCPNCDEWPLPF